MKRLLSFAAAVLLFASPVRAAEPSAKIIEYGRYHGDITGFEPAQGVSGNVLVHTTNMKLVETTQKIPAAIGETFGILVEYSNLPTTRDFVIHDVTMHPPIKQPDGKVLTQSDEVRKFKAGTRPKDNRESSRWTFAKGFEYELIPGEWTEVLSVDDIEVARMTFHVYKP